MSVKSDGLLDDVGVNMMGIKSANLYKLLNTIVDKKDVTILTVTDPKDLFPDLIYHLTTVIPNELFRSPPTAFVDKAMKQLEDIGEYLKKKFMEKSEYPFTIVRICELCYDPFKYYKVFELEKFTRAITRCCYVTSYWNTRGSSRVNEIVLHDESNKKEITDDVALTKIPWITKSMEEKLIPFAKCIDEIMSINLGFDDDEEDDDIDIETDKNNYSDPRQNMNMNSDDIMIEEYYEEEDGKYDDLGDDRKDVDEDEDEDEDDFDYVEKPEDEEEYDDDNVDEEEEREYNDANDSNEADENEIENRDDNNEFQDMKVSSYKRRTTEVDDFDYKNESDGSLEEQSITPKKLRQYNMIMSTSPMMSVNARGTNIPNVNIEEKNILVSPDSLQLSDKDELTISKKKEYIDNYDNSNKNDSPLTSKVRKA
ncbi:hypothetical protein TPHA_0I02890 [Tetrapisispora phaffii CBS 4417]|uniref:Serine/threonine-protein phosphatase 4 regulatory subunit 2 n=1 Tax=Tetrapisispora phaffii (strain ATCC 24235 / CBS 4417 / NBRC 1672 / NRRL Y-8282 / UCD 70-5) TaxID=1071381 RepID=G8BY12_TETPH|nr:hypothetical protein TPHA_0I02890 [Tetrapisispora phaffii CBS 4417]CCE64790.1 hypothetical protein TPHA_0I02890 [Tetrapisispora phaffii CBS 4417]